MPGFNPLDHPVCFSTPSRFIPTSWAAHIPFALYLIDALRPRVIVELGTFGGVAYCAFCQAVKELRLNTRCYAVNTWEADAQNNFPAGPEMFQDLKAHHDPLYGDFSSLIRNSFDEAIPHFNDDTIDLLHLNNYHAYDMARRDFENWLPKMSGRGVVLLHHINRYEPGRGVWKLWEELRSSYPSFEFTHGEGLGLVSTGAEIPAGLGGILKASEEERSVVREFFRQTGQRLTALADKEQLKQLLSTARGDEAQKAVSSSNRWQALDSAAQARLASQQEIISEQQEIINALSTELTAKEERLNAILNSRAWRWVSRYGRAKMRYVEPAYKALRHPLRRRQEEQQSEARHHGSREDSALAVPKVRPADEVERSLVLLPEPNPEQLFRVLTAQSADASRRKPDVICFSIIDWDFRYQRPQQIMSQFAAHGHRVFHIKLNGILPTGNGPRFAVREIKRNVYEVTLAAARQPGINQEVMGGMNAESLLNSLNALRRACHIDEAIGYVMTPSWTNVARSAKMRWGWRIIYDCMDEWEGFPGVAQAVANAERELVRDCDLLVVTAANLFEKWRQRERPTALVRNGVDFDFFAERCRPNTLLAPKACPVVGYYGAIAEWFDLELMIHVARRRPGYTFVLLGGIFDVDVSELRSLPNVRLLGQQPYEMMPLYLHHFDACLIPFKLNAITHATDPVKMYEYLSAGKAVVSVALSEIEPFREYLYIAESHEDFLDQLDRAVSEDDQELAARRSEFARRNTWRERYEAVTAALSSAVPRASIIIVTYNNLALNKLCLESILRNTEHPNYEVIVVDNNSSDATPDYLRALEARHSHLRVILNADNYGFARATNQGVARSTGEDLVFLNNDTVVPSGWLSRLLKHLDDPQVGMVGPVTNFVGNEAKIAVDYQTWAEMESFAEGYVWAHDGQVADIGMLAMFCVALRRKTYAAIGPLDEQFGIGMFEDDDYTQRLKAAGLRVVCAADVFVHHFGQAAFRKLIERGEYEGLFNENQRRYEAKWNIKWIPHRHAQLTFATHPTSPLVIEHTGKS
jgi:GT2 family glycosyltransferase